MDGQLLLLGGLPPPQTPLGKTGGGWAPPTRLKTAAGGRRNSEKYPKRKKPKIGVFQTLRYKIRKVEKLQSLDYFSHLSARVKKGLKLLKQKSQTVEKQG